MSKIQNSQIEFCEREALKFISEMDDPSIAPEIIAMSLISAAANYLALKSGNDAVARTLQHLAADRFALAASKSELN